MLEIISIASIFLLSIFLIMRNFRYALYVGIVLSVLLHKELFSFYRWDFMPVRAFMLAVLVSGGLYVLFHLKNIFTNREWVKKLKDPFLISLLVLWIIRGVSIIFSRNLTASIFLYGFFTTVIFLMVMMFLNLKNSETASLKYVEFYVLISFLLTLFGYFQITLYLTTGKIIGALWNIPGNIPRVGTTFWDVNHFASLLAAMIPLAGILFLTEKKLKVRIYYAIAAISMALTLFLTNSRTSWILLFVAGLFFVTAFLVNWKGWKSILFILLAALMIIIPASIEYSNKASPFRAKIKQYFHYRMDSFDSHFMLLTGALQVFDKYPILGGGYGSFFEHFSKTKIAPTFFGRDPAALNTRVPAHTIWGELLAETGMAGFTVFIVLTSILIGLLLYNFSTLQDSKQKLLNLGMGSVVIGWLVAGVFYSYNSEFFWIIWGLFYLYGISSLKKETTPHEVLGFYTKSFVTYLLLISLIASFLIFLNLGKNHLIPWDEAIYAKIAKNMVVNNEYVVQTWRDGKVWYEKPPLYMWMMSGMMNLLGFGSLAARLPSAIFGFLTVIVTFIFANKLFGKSAGFFAAFILVTTTQFLYYSRTSMLDVSTTFFITSSLYFYYTSTLLHSRKRLFISGLLAGSSVMIKGVVGLLPVAVIGIYEITQLFISPKETRESFVSLVKRGLVFLIGLLIISAPWHLEMYRRFGPAFWNNYIGYHVLDRATSAIEDKGRPFFWYVTVIKVSMRIWFVALIPSIIYLLIKVLKREKPLIFLAIWMSVIFLVFSSATSKLVWYIIPIYPVAAIITGLFIKKLFDFLFNFLKMKNYMMYKFYFTFVFVIFGLGYLYFVKNLVYTSDLTGSEARLIMEKDIKFEKSDVLYADRIELPLLLYYSDGPFKIIDFHPDKKDRVPESVYNKPLILLTKKGRYKDTVVGKAYKPVVYKEDGDYILWYFQSELELDRDAIDSMKKQMELIKLDPAFRSEYDKLFLEVQKKEIEIQQKLSSI
jgi:4-amino-4-deoxy-L-arabinose transferase-like glycosyltransferase